MADQPQFAAAPAGTEVQAEPRPTALAKRTDSALETASDKETEQQYDTALDQESLDALRKFFALLEEWDRTGGLP